MIDHFIQRQPYERLDRDEMLKVKLWMLPDPDYLTDCLTVQKAAQTIAASDSDFLPIVDKEMKPVGIITAKTLLNGLIYEDESPSLQHLLSKDGFSIVRPNDSLLDIYRLPFNHFFVVNRENKLVGFLSRKEISKGLSWYIKKLTQVEHAAEILNIILESAYEGITVVDEQATIVEFNAAYSRFIGIDRAEAIGRHVQEVIDNTNLHNTVKTGMPERGEIQYIQGQPMIVHRIPIWKNNRVIGAIGMVIFEGVKELYKIYERLQINMMQKNEKRQLPPITNQKSGSTTLDQIIGTSESTSNLKRMARKVAKTNATVLITGESGTGKELYAESIHNLSPISSGSFISVNCGAIPEHLFEAELFGYEEGAFTGAIKGGKPGKFELAKNGTLFLDEIGEMPLLMQTKLLRVLQKKEFERVGGTKKYKVNTRIIAATNRNLQKMVAAGHFREDLYYRINVIELSIDPLRVRRGDIPPLVSHYLKAICDKYERPVKELTPEAMQTFIHYDWYGNIRELVNVIEKLVILVEGNVIHAHHLPDFMQNKESDDSLEPSQNAPLSQLKSFEHEREKNLIIKVLKNTKGNKTKAAKELGIHRTTLYQKLKKHGLT